MKRLIFVTVLFCAAVFSSCGEFDDTEIWNKLDNHEERISALEELCKQMNTNISALQTIVNALQENDYVTGVAPITKDGETVGYTITFSKSDPITIYHGEDGYTPQIGVKQDTDNVYYWTLDGEWMLDDNGNKIQAQGITPKLKVKDDYWHISYDNGATWEQLGKATGEDGSNGTDGADGEDGDSFIKEVTVNDDYVIFTLTDGTELVLPQKEASPEISVLLIGSSHGMNSISQFPYMAYKDGINITVGNAYRGGIKLQEIAEAITNDTNIGGWFKVFKAGKWTREASTKFTDIITAEQWDYIIVQRSAAEDEIWTPEQSTALEIIIKQIIKLSDNNPRILFNSGFADPWSNIDGQKEKSVNIITTAQAMKKEHQIDIIPIATAMQNARLTSLAKIGYYTAKQLCYDSQHLDYGIGCYVASATIYETILRDLGWSVMASHGYATLEEARLFVEDLVDIGSITGAAYTEPTSETMYIAKLCAVAAVNDPNSFADNIAQRFPND